MSDIQGSRCEELYAARYFKSISDLESRSDWHRQPILATLLSLPGRFLLAALPTFMAYAGRYTFTCDTMVHHIEVASLQNWVNTDQTRFVHIEGNRLFVRNTPQLRGGVMVTIESVWERLK